MSTELVTALIKHAETAFEIKNYPKSFQFFTLAIHALEKKEDPDPGLKSLLITTLTTKAIRTTTHAYRVYIKGEHTLEYIDGIEKEVLGYLSKAQTIWNTLSSRKSKSRPAIAISSAAEECLETLRNACWNHADTLMTTPPKPDFREREKSYLEIVDNLNKYLSFTNKMTKLTPRTQAENRNAAQEYIAEVYDWLSDLNLDFALSKSNPPLASEFKSQRFLEAIRFNQSAVTLWTEIKPEKDIISLHLGYLNILHHAYEYSSNQSHLRKMSDYIFTHHLNVPFDDDHITWEIIGHQLMIAVNSESTDHELATELAQKITAIDKTNNWLGFSYYNQLAKTYLANLGVESQEIIQTIPLSSQDNARKRKRLICPDEDSYLQCLMFKPETKRPASNNCSVTVTYN